MARLVRYLGIAVAVIVLSLTNAAMAAKTEDLDNDGVDDAADNCPANPNGHQENTDEGSDPTDVGGDVCDRDTINPIIETELKGKNPIAWHVSTPWYRARVNKVDASIAFSAENGFAVSSQSNAGIGIDTADDSDVVTLAATGSISGVAKGYRLAKGPSIQQSTWQSVTVVDLFSARRSPDIPLYVASGANGLGLGFEVQLDAITPGQDLAIELALQLPPHLCLDISDLVDGIGKATIRDCITGDEKIRLSTVGVGTSGHETVLEDTPNKFLGLGTIEDELLNDENTPDATGTNFYDGVEGNLVESRHVFHENMADGTFGRLVYDETNSTLTIVASADVLDRNRATSHAVMLGLGLSSTKNVDFGTGATAYCRHIVGFDEEVKVTGTDTTLQCENDTQTFDGGPVDYAGLFPFGGGTAAEQMSASQQNNGMGFGGSVVDFDGTTLVKFIGGGAGVFVSAGGRVGPAGCPAGVQPIVWPDAGRCAEGYALRGQFKAETLIIHHSLAGLMCSDSDCEVEKLEFIQGENPNATKPAALKAGGGVGCASSRGFSFGVNPATDQLLLPGPVKPGCDPADVARGECFPEPYEIPASSGICNMKIRQLTLIGMGSTDPLANMNLTIPSGPAISFSMVSGSGEIGSKSFNSATGRCEADPNVDDPAPSLVKGFEMLATLAGGANKSDLGIPLTAEDPNAIPPITYCVDNIEGDELETGFSIGPNTRAELTRCAVRNVAYGALSVIADSANVATTGDCQEQLDGACRSPIQEFACPGCKIGGDHFMAVAGSGLTAPIEVFVRQCELGLDASGSYAAGQSPTLQAMALSKDKTSLVVDETPIGSGPAVTVGKVAAAMLKSTVQIGLGADQKLHPNLVKVQILNSNVGLAEENGNQLAVGIGNRNASGADPSGFTLEDNCFAADDPDNCAASDLLGSSAADSEVQNLESTTSEMSASLPKPAGSGLKTPLKCYTTEGSTPLPEVTLTTDDVFFDHRDLDATLVRTLDFCNPVSQDGDPVSDIFANLHCYEIHEDATPDRDVEVSSDFGVHTLTGVRAQALCMPAVFPGDELSEAQGVLDAFKCYQRADAGGTDEKVALLEDGFEAKSSRVKLDPFWVCNPVSIEGVQTVVSSDDHLACYKLSDAEGEPAFPGATATVMDPQFSLDLQLDRSQFLCSRATAKRL